MKDQSKRFYFFDAFRIDVCERLLYHSDNLIALTPKAFDTLLVLVENSRHVLSKEELMEKVWPNTYVEENNLAQNISVLRKALESGGQKFIETVPRRGYRFVADVSESFEGAEGAQRAGHHSKIQSGYHERARKGGKLFLRDVVIIGRAVDFK